MEVEVEAIKNSMEILETVQIAGMTFLKGTLGSTNAVVCRCGIGKVFAAACAQAMIMCFAPDFILNMGVCGALTKEVKTGDIILGEKVLQYDMDTSAVGDPIGLISGINKIYFDCHEEINEKIEQILKCRNINYKKGVIATGDKFINDSALVKYLQEEFDAVGGDMESGSIGHVCYINGIPFVILHAMSDGGDENSHDDYASSLDFAVKNTVEVVLEFCK